MAINDKMLHFYLLNTTDNEIVRQFHCDPTNYSLEWTFQFKRTEESVDGNTTSHFYEYDSTDYNIGFVNVKQNQYELMRRFFLEVEGFELIFVDTKNKYYGLIKLNKMTPSVQTNDLYTIDLYFNVLGYSKIGRGDRIDAFINLAK